MHREGYVGIIIVADPKLGPKDVISDTTVVLRTKLWVKIHQTFLPLVDGTAGYRDYLLRISL